LYPSIIYPYFGLCPYHAILAWKFGVVRCSIAIEQLQKNEYIINTVINGMGNFLITEKGDMVLEKNKELLQATVFKSTILYVGC